MKVISINVSEPRVLAAGGEQVETGILKTPMPGRIQVGKLNLQGDRQADLSVHGGPNKAVYVYSWENTLFWKTALPRDDLRPGSFGENLTVEGLLEDQVAIGDELEIGTARFQVTQPRLPCFKLGLALGLPSFPKAFLESGRTGFYLRVMQEGTIQAGDPIHLIPSREVAWVTIAEFVEIYRTQQASRDQVARISSLTSLPQTWKDWLARKFPEACK
ncbi:MAG: MOSC domain-containing protein [Acidobacteriia bacterium]|nr:MOSC domain-containing protein [Terriglobia bacterium]